MSSVNETHRCLDTKRTEWIHNNEVLFPTFLTGERVQHEINQQQVPAAKLCGSSARVQARSVKFTKIS